MPEPEIRLEAGTESSSSGQIRRPERGLGCVRLGLQCVQIEGSRHHGQLTR
jgi:hypothetical protein